MREQWEVDHIERLIKEIETHIKLSENPSVYVHKSYAIRIVQLLNELKVIYEKQIIR